MTGGPRTRRGSEDARNHPAASTGQAQTSPASGDSPHALLLVSRKRPKQNPRRCHAPSVRRTRGARGGGNAGQTNEAGVRTSDADPGPEDEALVSGDGAGVREE